MITPVTRDSYLKVRPYLPDGTHFSEWVHARCAAEQLVDGSR
jgi:hypothetical protein